jgi:hypothetical protein
MYNVAFWVLLDDVEHIAKLCGFCRSSTEEASLGGNIFHPYLGGLRFESQLDTDYSYRFSVIFLSPSK